ncbi:TPA: hypothetical protein ACH3X2_013996 [Trebouxia sp. C0005]
MDNMSALEQALDILPIMIGRAGSPEVSSSNQSGGSASGSAGSLGVQDFMNPDILKTAKLWRFQKLSRG